MTKLTAMSHEEDLSTFMIMPSWILFTTFNFQKNV